MQGRSLRLWRSMSRRSAAMVLAICAVAGAIALSVAPGHGDHSLPVLGDNLKPLSKRFNALSDRARFLAILSPT